MMACIILVLMLAVASAQLPDPDILKLDEQQFHQVADGDGNIHTVDLWVSPSDLQISSYNPDSENVYYLFTSKNPSTPQIIIFNNADSVTNSFYRASKRTAILIPGWRSSIDSKFFPILIKGVLTGEDMNVIAVDWSAGADKSYPVALMNTVPSGESVARFITWMNSVTGDDLSSFHIVGHSLGGHQAGIVGRNLGGVVPYITALDAAMPGWVANKDKFNKNDGIYTESIHTASGTLGYGPPLALCSFYPNRGVIMTGCLSPGCSHSRSFEYMGESCATGGFTATLCSSYANALTGTCYSSTKLKMGGLWPKTGQSGIYYLETNADPLYSKG